MTYFLLLNSTKTLFAGRSTRTFGATSGAPFTFERAEIIISESLLVKYRGQKIFTLSRHAGEGLQKGRAESA
jgi:hypothetical protein